MGTRSWVAFGLASTVLVPGLASRAEARGGWNDIPFVYVYEANAGEDAYVALDNELGCLDGEWRRSDNSDEWDGSTPEPGDLAPGGIVVQDLPGEAEDGGDASVLDIEDVGDPRGVGYPDPGNRKLFLWRDTSAELDLADGVTLVARWRLNPEPLSSEFANNGGALAVPNGYNLHSGGKGQIGFAQKTAVGGTIPAMIALTITDLGYLQFASNFANDGACSGSLFPAENCVDVDENGWVSAWLALQDDGAGGVQLRLYLNGEPDPVVDQVFTGLPTGFENTPLPEGGGPVTSYIQMALGATGPDGAIQIDYLAVAQGFQDPPPEPSPCPAALTAKVQGNDVVLAWFNGEPVPTSVEIRRDGVTIAAAAPADPPTYTDANVGAGAFTYELRATVPGETCDPLTATVSTCPTGLSATLRADGMLLSWSNTIEYGGLKVLRDGVEIEGALSGTATTYVDAAVQAGTHTWAVAPTTGTCAPVEVTATYIAPPGQGDFLLTSNSWTYELDPPAGADPSDYLRFQPTANVAGALDGAWSRGNGSDSWDSTAPGEVEDPLTDVADQPSPPGSAPGGIGLVDDGDVGAYLIEDVGDPTTAAQGAYLDPSNRKVYVAHDMSQAVEDANSRSLISDGLTLRARFRLTPADRAVDVTTAPDGMLPNNDGKGIFTIAHDVDITGAGASQRIGLGLDVNPAGPAGSGVLVIGQGDNEIRIPIADPTEWLDLWLAVEDADGDPLTPELLLTVWANGSATPLVDVDDFVPNAQGAEFDGPGNSLYMGLNSTPEVGSIEVDLVAFLDGVQAPVVDGKPKFHRGDPNDDGQMNITDGIYVLNFLFLGGAAPTCDESADANDDGQINITDGIFILNFLFLGGGAPPEPGSPDLPCGTDRADSPADLGCASYVSCG